MKLTKSECYKILGVPENTSDQDVKKRYRSLAKKYHPDVSQAPNSQELFAQISRAYESILSNDFKVRRAATTTETPEEKEKRRKERYEAAKERFEQHKRKEQQEEEKAFIKFKNKTRPLLLLLSIPFVILCVINSADLMLPYKYETFPKGEYRVSGGVGIPTIVSLSDDYHISIPSKYLYELKKAPYLRVQKLGLSLRNEGLEVPVGIDIQTNDNKTVSKYTPIVLALEGSSKAALIAPLASTLLLLYLLFYPKRSSNYFIITVGSFVVTFMFFFQNLFRFFT